MMASVQAESAEARFHEASEHLYNALRDAFGRSLSADQPIVRAISEYGQACRMGADWHEASEHVYRALRFHLGGTWGAHQPLMRALSEYGQACRDLNRKAA